MHKNGERSACTKAENKARVSSEEKRPRVVKQCHTPRKTMFSIVFTCNKKFHVAITSRGQTVDSDYFINFQRDTGVRWRKLCSYSTCVKDLLLQFDNARAHAARKTKEFLERREVKILVSSSVFSGLLKICATCGYFLQ